MYNVKIYENNKTSDYHLDYNKTSDYQKYHLDMIWYDMITLLPLPSGKGDLIQEISLQSINIFAGAVNHVIQRYYPFLPHPRDVTSLNSWKVSEVAMRDFLACDLFFLLVTVVHQQSLVQKYILLPFLPCETTKFSRLGGWLTPVPPLCFVPPSPTVTCLHTGFFIRKIEFGPL